ncbi:MAG: hypothetical protein ACOX2K_12180 [Bacillota bacterium]|jgi:hypothetical protein
MTEPRHGVPSLRNRLQLARPINLQRFAGGANLRCQTCSYYRDCYCQLHQKQMDCSSQACSHYQAKRP